MLRWVALILLLILIGLQVKLWGNHGGMHEDRLLQRNQALGADVKDLKNGEQAVEARARSELGLIKPGEVFYQVVEKPAAGSSAPAPATSTGGP
jgi:cell division protein FtsB